MVIANKNVGDVLNAADINDMDDEIDALADHAIFGDGSDGMAKLWPHSRQNL